MKKTVLFVILDQYADWEAAYLAPWIPALGRASHTVRTISLDKAPITSMGGFTVVPDYEISGAPTDFAGLILIGGMSWRTESARQVSPLVRHALDSGKVVGGICDAAGFLGTLGVLNQVRHTGNDLEDLKQWGGKAYTGQAHYLRQAAVRDRNIVTANGTATLEFAREVMLALDIAPEKSVAEWYDFHKRGCYQALMPEMAPAREV